MQNRPFVTSTLEKMMINDTWTSQFISLTSVLQVICLVVVSKVHFNIYNRHTKRYRILL